MDEPLSPDPTPAILSDPAAAPHERARLLTALRRPDALLEVVLGAPERLAAHARTGAHGGLVALLLLLSSTLFALPYGCVFGAAGFWKVAALYLGSTLICVPALQVFAAYLGVRARPHALLLLALEIPAVAGLFTLGFAPILAFLKWTMAPGEAAAAIDWRMLSNVMLAGALVAGIGQLGRCFAAGGLGGGGSAASLVVTGWLLVFLLVLARMANVLGLS